MLNENKLMWFTVACLISFFVLAIYSFDNLCSAIVNVKTFADECRQKGGHIGGFLETETTNSNGKMLTRNASGECLGARQ